MREVSERTREVVTRALRDRLGPHGFREAEISAGEDHEGDPVIFVTARFDLVPRPIDASITFDMTSAIQDALATVGEERFPILSFDFDDRQEVATHSSARPSPDHATGAVPGCGKTVAACRETVGD